MLKISLAFVFLINFIGSESAKILGVFPVPVLSHQYVFRTLTNELVKRGHEVTVISGLPVKEAALPNYTEIDLSYTAYEARERMISQKMNPLDDMLTQFSTIIETTYSLIVEILLNKEVDALIKDKSQHFDLIFIEDCLKPSVIMSHFFKAPVISISSFGGTFRSFETIGGAVHPILHPLATRKKYRNLSLWDKFKEIYNHYQLENLFKDWEIRQDEIYKKYYGADVPPLHDLYNNVKMLFLNIHSIWDSNRPVPANVIYLGGLHQRPQKELPKNLQLLLDSSTNGAVYMSLGTVVDELLLKREVLQIFVKVFSKLPYNVFWKWDGYEITGLSENVKILPWFPQSDMLRHPNLKLFITQGGLQSTDEAISAGVPFIGVPIIFDQYFNTNKYVELKIGQELHIESITEEKVTNAITEVINNKSYKENVIKLRSVMNDSLQTSLERAVFWTEYVLKHGGDHLKTPSANMSWFDYYEMNLVICSIFILLIAMIIFIKMLNVILKIMFKKRKLE